MNESPLELIAVFISTHETLRAEKFIRKAKLPFRPVIKPRNISSNCQMGLQFNREYLTEFLNIAKLNQLNLSGVYEKTETFWKKKDF